MNTRDIMEWAEAIVATTEQVEKDGLTEEKAKGWIKTYLANLQDALEN